MQGCLNAFIRVKDVLECLQPQLLPVPQSSCCGDDLI